MFVCDHCSTLWALRLQRCGRCREPGLRPFGDRDSDFDMPVVSKFPLRKAYRRPALPSARDPVDAWRRYALARGHSVDDVAAASKTRLRQLVGA